MIDECKPGIRPIGPAPRLRLLLLWLVFILLLFVVSKAVFFHQQKEIAITLDDLPYFDSNKAQANRVMESMINVLVRYQVPVIGFVIAGHMNTENAKQLDLFLYKKFQLGNHTFSHPSLRHTSAESYIKNIALADQALAPYLSKPKYFRYPNMAQGKGDEKKIVQRYLKNQGYVIAPVTIDSKDWKFNVQFYLLGENANPVEFQKLKIAYLDFILSQMHKAEFKDKWLSLSFHSKKQILLLHANRLNSYLMEDVLHLFKTQGYQFVTLDDAIEDTP